MIPEIIIKESESLKKLLKQKKWGSMTYMLIPSVLESTKNLIEKLKKYKSVEAVELRDELAELLKNFKREKL